MRWAILLLISGILTMADYSPKDLARALMGARPAAAQGQASPQDLERARLAKQAREIERRALTAPGRIGHDEHERLSRLAEGFKISREQYEAATGMNNPPPGVDPDEWRGSLMPLRTRR
jgi:hypothetical protein